MTEDPISIPTITAPDAPADKVTSSFLGNLEFTDGYPTTPTLAKLYDALDYQRAVQVVLRNVAAHSMHCFRAGLVRDLGVDAPTTLAVFRADARSLMLTPNSETLYGTIFLRLDVDGPTVLEAPAEVTTHSARAIRRADRCDLYQGAGHNCTNDTSFRPLSRGSELARLIETDFHD